ncbi:MAG: hypothetical protein V1836_02210 [Candidatus Aenigmatarchaeota archaeon]
MKQLNESKTGLVLATFVALLHVVWSVIVAVIPGSFQSFLDWVFTLHHLKPFYALLPFNLGNAVLLVILTFVFGYVFGYAFAAVWNWAMKQKF